MIKNHNMIKILLLVCWLSQASGEKTWLNNSRNDSCWEERGGIYPCSSTITGNLLLMVFYGAILGVAAKLISDGAELLLDLNFSPSIIGGVVLPILGAIPDSAIIVASAMGDDAQEKLSVGMGTLAGSTVMLLTIAWSASLWCAKCNFDTNGVSQDKNTSGKISLTQQGITLLPEIRAGVIIMLVTSLFYFVVQSADWYWGATKTLNQPKYVQDSALATMILCIIGLVCYIVYSIFDSKRNDRLAKLHKEEITKRHVLHAMVLLADKQTFKPSVPEDHVDHDEHAVSKKFFTAWKIKKGTRDAQEKLQSVGGGGVGDENTPLIDDQNIDISEPIEEKEDSKLKIALKSISMLIGGVALVTIFSDPMCDVLTALADKRNRSYIPIPPFYISFVVTPFCSNASELVSSLIFASKKTRENATMTYSQLFGAATMNNTMCLAIFMALVYFKNLEWYYGAEVLCIILVQWVIGLISLQKSYKLWLALPVAAVYVVCIALVYVLEHVAHWM